MSASTARALDAGDSASILQLRCRDWLAALPGNSPAQLDWLTSTASTNSLLLERGPPPVPGAALLSEIQSGGRGRMGRGFSSMPGGSLCLSLAVPWPQGPAAAAGVSLLAGAAVAEILQQQGLDRIGLKWPNDLMVDGAKLGGLLVESAGTGARGALVIGLGLNIDLPDEFSPGQPWTDLRRCGLSVDRAELAARLIKQWLRSLEQLQAQGLPSALQAWRQFDLLLAQPIRVLSGEQSLDGVGQGIDDSGRLRVLHASGERSYSSAEVSVRPR